MLRRRRISRVLLLAFVAAIVAAPCFGADEVFQQTYPLPPGGKFQLQNVNGSVQVSGWERNEVEIRAVKTARQDAPDLQRVRIEVEARPDSIAVETRYPNDEGVEVYVEYRVRVPRQVRLSSVATVNGKVRVSGVEAVGHLRSVNGNIEVFDSAGRVNARTTNGNVRLELRHLDASGPLSVETVNGSVVLVLPADASAELEVRNINGDFRSELPVTVKGSLGSRAFQGRLGAGGSLLRIRTVNGTIRLERSTPVV